jgi:hypothetical protein
MVVASLAFQEDTEAVFMVTIITVTSVTAEAIEAIQEEEAIKAMNSPLMEVTRTYNAPMGALFVLID